MHGNQIQYHGYALYIINLRQSEWQINSFILTIMCVYLLYQVNVKSMWFLIQMQ